MSTQLAQIEQPHDMGQWIKPKHEPIPSQRDTRPQVNGTRNSLNRVSYSRDLIPKASLFSVDYLTMPSAANASME